MAETDNAPKTEGTPAAPSPAPAAPAAGGSKPADGKAGAKGKPAEPAAPGADWLKENLSTIALVVAIAAAVVVVGVFQVRKDRSYNDGAWTALAELRQKSPTSTEGFTELLDKYRGSEADPYIRLTYASRLYEAGTREQVEQARAQLETVLNEHQGNAFLGERVAAQLARIKAELDDPRAQLAAKPAGDAAGIDTSLELGDGHGPDDGHGH